ncbi:LexA family transcriptional regulator [Coprobacter sp.]|jgi:putative phage repressor|uniref:LexA family transcriptional regulator n=1 Tax=Coprobacter sp. TaxID=1941478 RepID=UPI0025EAE3CD|nr:S24 family peptidase [uncultured Coprobacter sp.]MBS6269798.1 helix-turn-helix domain-containing protein [Tannerella sp.]
MPQEELISRIRELIKEMSISQNEFADRIKIDRSNFSKHINGKLPISDSLLNKIVVSLGISKEWLNSGEGEKYYITTAHNQTISLPTNVIHTNGQKGAKVYDIDVTAGPIGRSLIFSTENLIGSIDVPFINNENSIVRVSGDSMQPVICNGDMVAIREVKNLNLIFWGQIYVVLLDDYRMVKYIRKHTDRDMVILRSANPEYDDIEIHKSEIRDLFIVENIIRFDSRM